MTHKLDNEKLSGMSIFFGQVNLLFKQTRFVKNFEVLNIVLFIYRKNNISGELVRFKDLQEYCSKSDVYLSTLLKSGISDNFLITKQNRVDRRVREYQLSDEALKFIEQINTQLIS
tara:strand:- start:652 stop:999 length:348 start_codon:yes stop_codon:yes gene_type:complete